MPERIAALVARWVRFYTRGLPDSIAARRIGEIDADLHDHIAHERAEGSSDARVAIGILSRMVRGVAADVSWRDERTRAAPDRRATTGGPMTTPDVTTRSAPSGARPPTVTILAVLAAIGGVGAVLGVIAGSIIHGLDSLDAIETIMVASALAMAVLYVVLAYGAWTLKAWGWRSGIVAGVGTIVLTTAVLLRGWADLIVDAPPLAVVSLLVIGIAAAALLAWVRPDVKAAFERA